MNYIDRIIASVAPEIALRREAARRKLTLLNSGYSSHGASHAKKSLLGWRTSARSADEDQADNLYTLRARSRDLYMGSPLATGAIKTFRTNVIGSGLRLDAQVDGQALGLSDAQVASLESRIEAEWSLWANTTSCDAMRLATFGQLQALVLTSALVSGDVFVGLPFVRRAGDPYSLRLNVIESDLICDPCPKPEGANIVEGVEVGNYGEVVAYYVARNHPGALWRQGMNIRQEWKRVLAYGRQTGRRNLLHIMADIERPGQRRGVPILAPVIESLKQLTRYTEAELMAAVVSGMFTVFVKSDSEQTPLADAFAPMDQVDSDDPNSYELGNGSIVSLGNNESIEVANPSRPSQTFDGFVTAMSRQIGAALELPYELLTKSFTASYSASRGALLEAWKAFRMRRAWIEQTFCQPVYEEWFAEAVSLGRISAPGFFDDPQIRRAYTGAEWCGPSQGQLDPLKEVNAAAVRVAESFSTRSREAAELTGMRYDTIIAARAKEEQQRTQNNPAAAAGGDNNGRT